MTIASLVRKPCLAQCKSVLWNLFLEEPICPVLNLTLVSSDLWWSRTSHIVKCSRIIDSYLFKCMHWSFKAIYQMFLFAGALPLPSKASVNSGSKTCTYPDSFHLKTLVCKRWSIWEWRLCWESSCWQSSYCWPLFFLSKSFYGISSLI